MSTETQQYYDDHLGCLFGVINYIPEVEGQDEVVWTFYTTCCEVILGYEPPEKPQNIPEGHAAVYDVLTRQWVVLEEKYMSGIEYMFWDQYTDKEKYTSHAGVALDPYTTEFEYLSGEFERTCCDITECLTHGVSSIITCDHFDHAHYIERVRDYIYDNDRQGLDPWVANFQTELWADKNTRIMWQEMFEDLGLSLEDFGKNTMDREQFGVRWKLLIQRKATDAGEFLNKEKEITLSDISTAEDEIDQTGLEEEIEELEVIKELIDAQVWEYHEMVDEAVSDVSKTDIMSIMHIWPPILLPLPYRREHYDDGMNMATPIGGSPVHLSIRSAGQYDDEYPHIYQDFEEEWTTEWEMDHYRKSPRAKTIEFMHTNYNNTGLCAQRWKSEIDLRTNIALNFIRQVVEYKMKSDPDEQDLQVIRELDETTSMIKTAAEEAKNDVDSCISTKDICEEWPEIIAHNPIMNASEEFAEEIKLNSNG